MEIINNFGIDPVLLGAQIVNFLIILYILKRFLYKPVLDVLKKRQEAIKEGLAEAEEASLALEKALEQEKKILKKAREQANKVVNDSKTQAETAATEIESEVKRHADKIIKDARIQTEQETKEAEKHLTEKISKLSLKLLDKALREMFTEKEEKQLIEKAIKQIQRAN